MKIKEVPYGLANNYGDYIEINENLREYPELYNAILEHELSHTSEKGFTKEDFLLDIGPSKVNYYKLFVFMCKHPRSFKQFLPIYKQDKAIVYDINMIIAWSTLLGVVALAIIIGRLL